MARDPSRQSGATGWSPGRQRAPLARIGDLSPGRLRAIVPVGDPADPSGGTRQGRRLLGAAFAAGFWLITELSWQPWPQLVIHLVDELCGDEPRRDSNHRLTARPWSIRTSQRSRTATTAATGWRCSGRTTCWAGPRAGTPSSTPATSLILTCWAGRGTSVDHGTGLG